MAIKFHRPFEDYAEGDIVELDPTMEDWFVRKNYADFTTLTKPAEQPTEQPVEAPKPRTRKAKA